jgi:hypothetical protein
VVHQTSESWDLALCQLLSRDTTLRYANSDMNCQMYGRIFNLFKCAPCSSVPPSHPYVPLNFHGVSSTCL